MKVTKVGKTPQPKRSATSSTPKLSKREREWRAQDDAMVIKRYSEIKKDKSRVTDAKNVLKKEADAINKAIKMK